MLTHTKAERKGGWVSNYHKSEHGGMNVKVCPLGIRRIWPVKTLPYTVGTRPEFCIKINGKNGSDADTFWLKFYQAQCQSSMYPPHSIQTLGPCRIGAETQRVYYLTAANLTAPGNYTVYLEFNSSRNPGVHTTQKLAATLGVHSNSLIGYAILTLAIATATGLGGALVTWFARRGG